ncbi:cytidine deaminase [Rubrobacter taiwanensis]|uniref:Cytidine deaminase n=1 Tax=Rubrobacter taiwanensis TaxID=185139 RepID=A0A4R1BJ20_9ACTN|nr:cytidine deaminase [Rubrobacter taiwanensis]TCJ17313.1 cytidine deaminase [Rubrobacter taiwanensis]
MREDLVRAAEEAARRAYAPYSGFRVGAAIRSGSGRVYTGCNVENASFGMTICAERNAAAAMVNSGERKVKTIAVVSPDGERTFPCGACRQVLHEFGCEEVVVRSENGAVSYPFREILPHAFGPEDL